MKVKNKDIVAFLNGIGGFKDKRFPVKVTYAINKNIKAVTGAAEAYNNTFDELRNQYMDKDAEGNIKYLINLLANLENRYPVYPLRIVMPVPCFS